MPVSGVHHGASPIDDPSASGGTADATASDPAPASTTRSGGRTRADVMSGIGAATTAGAPSPADILKLVDGAKTRILLKIPDLKDKTLLTHLKDAAKRGVDVPLYMPSPKTGSGKTVLDEQGLEANGVDTTVDRTDRLPGFTMVADGSAIVAEGSSGAALTKDATAVAKAAKDCAAAVKEPSSTGGSAIPANGVKVLAMPDATGAAIVDAIDSAKKSIDLEVYSLQDPAVTAALQAAARRGVKVRVMLEPRTVGASNFAAESAKLKAAGVIVQATPPAFDSHRNVDHAKFMVIDGKSLLLGTGNLVRSGLGGNPAKEFDNRDFWIEDGRAESAKEGAALFQADWDRESTTGIDFQNLVVTPDNADARILELIDGAKKRLFVENQSLSDPQVIERLIAAKRRGCDVRVLLGYQPGFGGGAPANQPALTKLQAAGIPAQFFTRDYLHAKAIVADDKAFLGSQNFTSGGLANNRELGEILDDPAAVKKIADTILGDVAKPTPP